MQFAIDIDDKCIGLINNYLPIWMSDSSQDESLDECVMNKGRRWADLL